MFDCFIAVAAAMHMYANGAMCAGAQQTSTQTAVVDSGRY